MGLQALRLEKAAWWANSTTQKCLLLLLADFYLRGTPPTPIVGLNFFGLIALSTAAIYIIARSPHPFIFSLLSGLCFFCLRYLPLGWIEQLPNFVTGKESTPGVSYPLAPWIIFSIVGYLASKATLPRSRYFLLTAIGVIALLLTLVMYQKEMVFHRWSTMSAAYFVASFAAIGLLHGCLGIMSNALRESNLMPRLNGIESFLIVPIHYFLISIVSDLTDTSTALFYYVLLASAISILTFKLSRHTAMLFIKLDGSYRFSWLSFGVACLAIELLRLTVQTWADLDVGNVYALAAMLLIAFKLHNSRAQFASIKQQQSELSSN